MRPGAACRVVAAAVRNKCSCEALARGFAVEVVGDAGGRLGEPVDDALRDGAVGKFEVRETEVLLAPVLESGVGLVALDHLDNVGNVFVFLRVDAENHVVEVHVATVGVLSHAERGIENARDVRHGRVGCNRDAHEASRIVGLAKE